MVNKPSFSPRGPEKTPLTISSVVVGVTNWVNARVKQAFVVTVPNELVARGLTQEIYNEISKRYYEMVRGKRSTDRLKIQKKINKGEIGMFGGWQEAMLADGWTAVADNRNAVLETLAGDFGFTDDREICMFLKDKLNPDPYLA
jgi:hypothetical protein